jgi:hypothetical protein
VCQIVFCPVLDHITVPGKEAAGVDAKVLNGDKTLVTARGRYILAVLPLDSLLSRKIRINLYTS